MQQLIKLLILELKKKDEEISGRRLRDSVQTATFPKWKPWLRLPSDIKSHVPDRLAPVEPLQCIARYSSRLQR